VPSLPEPPTPDPWAPAEAADPSWTIEVGDDLRNAQVAESLLTVADGRFGTRGSLEEDGETSPDVVLAADLFERVDGRERLVAIPGWVALPVRPGLPPGRRWLDLRSAVVHREVTDGGTTLLRSARFVALARPGTCVLLAHAAPGVLGSPEELREVEARSPLGGGARAVEQSEPDDGDRAEDGARRIRRVAFYGASPRRMPAWRTVRDGLRDALAVGPDGLLAEQAATWARRWDRADVCITGSPELTRAVRFAVLQLMMHAGQGPECALGPRGMSGQEYGGHVLWDADVFVLPFLAATHLPSALAVLRYRTNRLEPARLAAARAGAAGARFPWESARDGSDVTPLEGLDQLGQVIPITTGQREEHVSADVAWAAWQLASWTGDWRPLRPGGALRPLVTETAAYWADRVRVDADGVGHIEGVIGPDEYHDWVDDDVFTNVLARWNLRRGAELLQDGTAAEQAAAWRWLELADRIITGYDAAAGRHEQFTGFSALEPLTMADVAEPPAPADVVLGHDRVGRAQIVKQADVLMAHHMVPLDLPAGSLGPDLDFYLPRTAHGSSLSPGIHAGLLARAGRLPEAEQLLAVACDIDLRDLTDSTARGLHLGGFGSIWQALVGGFAGVRVTRPDDPALTIDPHVPPHWGTLEVSLVWHGRRVRLRCGPEQVAVECASRVPVAWGDASPVVVQPPGGLLVRVGDTVVLRPGTGEPG